MLLMTASGQFRRWSNNYAILSPNGGRNVATGGQWTGPAVIVAQAPLDFNNFAAYRMFRNGVQVTDNTNNLGATTSASATNVFQSSTGDRQVLTYWAAPVGLVAKWDRYLSDAEINSVSANPWQIFEQPARPLWAPASTITVYRPGSDVSGSWTAVGGASVAATLADEAQGNYAESPDLSTPQVCTWNPPLPAGNWTIPVGGLRTASAGQVRIVCLDAGGASVGATAWQALTLTPTLYSLTVTTSATSTQFRIEVQP